MGLCDYLMARSNARVCDGCIEKYLDLFKKTVVGLGTSQKINIHSTGRDSNLESLDPKSNALPLELQHESRRKQAPSSNYTAVPQCHSAAVQRKFQTVVNLNLALNANVN